MNAAAFAAGFLKGANVGEFQDKDLMECLEKEKDAERIFAEAQNEWV